MLMQIKISHLNCPNDFSTLQNFDYSFLRSIWQKILEKTWEQIGKDESAPDIEH